QMTYLGYPHITGLATIDYCLTDGVADPIAEDTRSNHGEKLIRLPGGFCCYAPLASSPDVGPLPAQKNKHITFGSLHSLAKLNSAVLDVWCSILHALPGARIVTYRHTLQGKAEQKLVGQFADRGIETSRIDTRHIVDDGRTHLDVYRDIDISLDTFPWSGHT